MSTIRTIVESDDAKAEIDRLRSKYDRFSDWWESGWSWRLARDPFTDATRLPGTNPQKYLLKTSENHADFGIPFTLTFMYTADDIKVSLIAVRFVDLTETE